MAMALYDPALGYYHAVSNKFGAGGDFITAPELSPLFAWHLAHPSAQALSILGNGDILEFGAGSGLLAAELLLELERLGVLPRRYLILELSGELKRRQTALLQARVPHLFARIEWLEALPTAGFTGVILANEVLDAMPVQCFALCAGAILEHRVSHSGDKGLVWSEQTADARLRTRVRAIIQALPEPVDDNYCRELNPALAAWM
jgi:SAM-dependent MidA family methyltransferase